MMHFPENWTRIRPGVPTRDPLTGNAIPSMPEETPWTALLQQRFPETKQDEFDDGHVAAELNLLITPGIPGGVKRRDVFRFDGPADVSDIVQVGDTVQVRGTPRTRRPARGSRRPDYIAAIVRHSSDMQEES